MSKVASDHLDRQAFVYVRQSTQDQLLHNHESRRRQYGLTERARQLGWAESVVIDDDLGRSGSGVDRPGFERLLLAICEGRVGIVLAVEASRLARRPDGSNPCRHVKRFREERRERFLSDAEYQRLGETLRKIERDGSETASATAAVRLLMLTGCRLSEIQKLRWEHVNLETGELRLPDTKTGAKVVHLGDPAIAVLRGIDREDGNAWVIAGRKPGSHLTDLQHPWRRIRAHADLDDVRIHDLRHSFASGGLLVGEGLPMIGKLHGHTQVQTTARYAHLANDPIKSAANRIASRIAEIAG